MTPPPFSDLGKEAKDVLNKNYHMGVVKLDVKTKTPLGIDFNLNGESINDTGKVNAYLESKHGWKEYGLTLKEKWNADNTVLADLSLKEPFSLRGLDLGASGFFAPQTGRKNGTLKTAFKNDALHFKGDLNIDHANTVLKSSAVLQHQNLLCGIEIGLDTNKQEIKSKQLALVYRTPDFVLHSNVSGDKDVTGSLYQKLNPRLQTSIALGYNNGSNTSKVNLGAVYKLDCCSSVRAKVNNSSQIGLGFTHKLRDGITLTLSALIEAKNLNQGGHKLGLGLEFQDV